MFNVSPGHNGTDVCLPYGVDGQTLKMSTFLAAQVPYTLIVRLPFRRFEGHPLFKNCTLKWVTGLIRINRDDGRFRIDTHQTSL